MEVTLTHPGVMVRMLVVHAGGGMLLVLVDATLDAAAGPASAFIGPL